VRVLVTGAAGFIGMHVARRLLERGDTVLGVDSLNDYYDPALKHARLDVLRPFARFAFTRLDIADGAALHASFAAFKPDAVVHLAAQAGVRYSLTNPHAYAHANLMGFLNMLEECRHAAIGHLVYASSSSVYGGNETMPFTEAQAVDHPISLYAATKKSNELMAHAYAHLYRFPVTGLRFFTVYGPWGRPDMAPILFAKAISEGRAIDVFNHGRMQRDFTYIDDVVEGVVRVLDKPATPDPAFDARQPHPATSRAPYRVFNIGNHGPVELMDFVRALERALGREASINFKPMQPGDVPATYADVSALAAWTGFTPGTPLQVGVERFVHWFDAYQAAPEQAGP
jgi:UDP-glucuronate 4-epimerase